MQGPMIHYGRIDLVRDIKFIKIAEIENFRIVLHEFDFFGNGHEVAFLLHRKLDNRREGLQRFFQQIQRNSWSYR